MRRSVVRAALAVLVASIGSAAWATPVTVCEAHTAADFTQNATSHLWTLSDGTVAPGSSPVACLADSSGSLISYLVIRDEANLTAAPAPPDFSNSNQLFEYGFSLVLFFFVTGVLVGSILSLVGRGR